MTAAETGLPPRLATMLNAMRTGQKDARVHGEQMLDAYNVRPGSAWATWYDWGFHGMPTPPALARRGIEI